MDRNTGRKVYEDIPAGRDHEAALFWNQELLAADTREKDWREEATKITKILRNKDDRITAARRGNMLWSTNQVIAPAIYSQLPTADVRRRYKLQQRPPAQMANGQQVPSDPANEVVGIMESVLEALIDLEDFDEALEAVRDDLLNVGRGVAWVVYRADIVKRPVTAVQGEPAVGVRYVASDGEAVDESAVEGEEGALFVRHKENEELKPKAVQWADYRESPARCREDVWWVARRHRMTKRQAVRAFGKAEAKRLFERATVAARETSLKTSRTDEKSNLEKEPDSVLARRTIWEIWCKPTKQRVWIEENGDALLKHVDALEGDRAPLDLRGFFPCPDPPRAVKTTESRVPIAEYIMWQDDDRDYDDYLTRAAAVLEMIKAVMFVKGQLQEKMPDVRDAADGTTLSMPLRHDAQTIADSIWMWPVRELVEVLVSLQAQLDAKKRSIFEKTGVSDLSRGMTDPHETAAAQRLKGAFGQFRMAPRAKPFQRMVRDTLRIMAEVAADQFDQETLEEFSGRQITPEALAILKNDRARSLRIDIETDSTVRPDVEQHQAQAIQFVEAQNNLLTGLVEVSKVEPALLPYVGSVAKAALSTFKFGRQSEDALASAIEMMERRAAQPSPPPQPTPDAQLKARVDLQKAQWSTEVDMTKAQTDRLKAAAEIVSSESDRDDALLNAELEREAGRAAAARGRRNGAGDTPDQET